MVDDIVINKKEVIERCIKRIEEVYEGDPDNLLDFTKQDSIILNIQRAIEACLDLAMHKISVEKLGVPQNGRDAFEILLKNGYIDETILQKMKSMIGFRNLAVHDYQKLNLEVLQSILEKHLYDFEDFSSRF
jgi:uncharacterized protein YutE (UPF0331/DUF86 family)